MLSTVITFAEKMMSKKTGSQMEAKLMDSVTKQQYIARCEKSLALEKLKKRRADTRRKIELGGLVIKAGMDGFSKSVILGALDHAARQINQDESQLHLFEAKGERLFLG